ncbi:hypothetical protein Shyhy01_69280 [Streptomyces hygroscopicus subsp. hygroscopicus]|nr:hypothetical protein Shyhy01_69280 [Streptomyces hygroscopicus subsp. hygroscopicus]
MTRPRNSRRNRLRAEAVPAATRTASASTWPAPRRDTYCDSHAAEKAAPPGSVPASAFAAIVAQVIRRRLHHTPPARSSQRGPAAKHTTDAASSATAAARPGRRTRVIRWYASASSRRRESATTVAAARTSAESSHPSRPGQERNAGDGSAPPVPDVGSVIGHRFREQRGRTAVPVPAAVVDSSGALTLRA